MIFVFQQKKVINKKRVETVSTKPPSWVKCKPACHVKQLQCKYMSSSLILITFNWHGYSFFEGFCVLKLSLS